MSIKIRQGGQWVEVSSSGGSGGSEPVGTIVAWAGSAATIPTAQYQLCDGNAPLTSELEAITGPYVPNLRDRFIVGAHNSTGDNTYPGLSPNATPGGSADAVVVQHNHGVTGGPFVTGVTLNQERNEVPNSPDEVDVLNENTSISVSTSTAPIDNEGVSATNKNLPPYYALCYIIKHTAVSSGGGGSGGGSDGGFTLLSEKSATGSSVEFTGIPSDALEITLMFNGVSSNGSNDYLIQLGTSSSYITSGYVSTSQNEKGDTQTDSDEGFIVFSANSGDTHHGKFDINKFSSTTYTLEGQTRRSTVAGSQSYGSLNSVSGTIDRLKIILDGSNDFNAGSFSLSYKTSGSGSGSVGGGGRVVQVVQATKTDTASVTGATFGDVGLSATISPLSSDNKILVLVQANIGASVGYDMKTRLMRGNTPIHVGDAAGNRPRVTTTITQLYGSTYNYNADQANINYLDDPNTTDPVTYKIQMASYDNYVVYINRSGADLNTTEYDGRGASSIILMEVLA